MSETTPIRVGITEAHGMMLEVSQFPPAGVEYSFVRHEPESFRFIRSPIKGYYRTYRSTAHDLLEAVLSPIETTSRWIYSIANLQEASAFNVLGLPLPRSVRIAWLRQLLLRDNCRKVVLWSEAGRSTLESYGGVTDADLGHKTTVVCPAVRAVADASIRFSEGSDVTLLFSGDFFRKGGVNVVDAFERCQRRFPSIRLDVCCDSQIDFNTPNSAMRAAYLAKLHGNPGIRMLGRIKRDRLLNEIMPQTDIYLLPTYAEAFGMVILEAMAFGIPVIATNHFAIPEIIDDEVSGLLIDTSAWDGNKLFRGYVVDRIPVDFQEHVTEQLVERLTRLIESPPLRKTIGLAALAAARSRFSFDARNAKMLQIYQEALS